MPEQLDLLQSYNDPEDRDDRGTHERVDPGLRVPLLRSFVETAWKGAALTEIAVTNFACLCDGLATFTKKLLLV